MIMDDATADAREGAALQGVDRPSAATPIHPVKRRTADRRDWARIARRRFAVARVDEAGFAGSVTLLVMDVVTEPFVGAHSGICFADSGYAWLTHFPDGAHHAVTTMFDAAGRLLQWYVDVCREHGLGPDGVPWWDDLYLDVVLRPTGEVLLLDEDELELALAHELVTPAEYALAWGEARRLLAAADGALNPAGLAARSVAHRELLLRRLNTGPALGRLLPSAAGGGYSRAGRAPPTTVS
jgi:predicted RNA-binding protein associated with RNAse of E/G family